MEIDNEVDECYPSYMLELHENIRGIQIKRSNGYRIYTYDRNMICFDAPIQIRQYRSVIFDEYGLVSFSPPRSVDYKNFDLDTKQQNIYINEAIEGIMVQLFYSASKNSWKIATRNVIGGNYLISDKTLLEMVLDVFIPSSNSPNNSINSINDIPAIQQLYQNYSYTFVLQHPNNIILLPIKQPALYVCAVYDISTYDDKSRAIYIPPPVYEEWQCFEDTPFLFPKNYTNTNTNTNTNINQVKKCVESCQLNMLCMGLMVTNLVTGDRCKFLNPDYMDAMNLNNLDPCLQYQYLCLHRINRINEYISYFPKQKTAFMQFSKQYRNFAKGLHESYLLRYVQKEKLETLEKSETKTKYTELVDRLHHEIYLPSLRKNKRQRITLDIVREYMRGLTPLEMMHYLNYDQRLLIGL